jgi:hypothetical protein
MASNGKIIDKSVQRVVQALKNGYGKKHPKARIEAYRYNPAAIRVRIIDPDFDRKGLSQREEEVWPFLEALPDDVFLDLSMLLLITPRERKQSFGNMEFDDPTPWVPLNLER